MTGPSILALLVLAIGCADRAASGSGDEPDAMAVDAASGPVDPPAVDASREVDAPPIRPPDARPVDGPPVAADAAVDRPGAGDSLPPAAGAYTCTHVFGGVMVNEWFGAFKKLVGSPGWQAVAITAATPDLWANPMAVGWARVPSSKCTVGAEAPDRVVYYAASFLTNTKLNNDAGWEKVFRDLVATIQLKFPRARRIDLVTVHAGPDNTVCGGDAKTSIPSAEAAGIAAAAASNPGLVFAGPRFTFPDCTFFNGHHYTGAGNSRAAQDLAVYLAGR